MLTEDARRLCQLFAEVLGYPGPSLARSAVECARQLDASFPGSAEPMRAFVAFAEGQKLPELQEIYTQTFDITPETTPYVGYHLFGETPKRSVFMAKLQEAYQSHQLSTGTELPDHLCVLMKFLSVARDKETVIPLLEEGILPILEKMEQAFHKDKNSYGLGIRSLRLFLAEISRKLTTSGGMRHG
ncbi:MAG: hypothetical protein CL875_00375 [Dehalococcoidales bacterium]|jgi:nitrate reductase delta subunit|nr:hypothetical protein [Dehalococcoidales bacterium]|tara:strand:- start:501 stop:1058 length:558 start_codon:yes stop_codon:yes gene_type:complete